jgi:hypothetical protein
MKASMGLSSTGVISRVATAPSARPLLALLRHHWADRTRRRALASVAGLDRGQAAGQVHRRASGVEEPEAAPGEVGCLSSPPKAPPAASPANLAVSALVIVLAMSWRRSLLKRRWSRRLLAGLAARRLISGHWRTHSRAIAQNPRSTGQTVPSTSPVWSLPMSLRARENSSRRGTFPWTGPEQP